jgi:hypothetical protein
LKTWKGFVNYGVPVLEEKEFSILRVQMTYTEQINSVLFFLLGVEIKRDNV